jgi:hypothetical protein
MMSCNIGGIERTIRINLGLILLLIGYFAGLPTWGAVVAYLLGAVALVTGAVKFCPLWLMLGINTCAPEAQAKG